MWITQPNKIFTFRLFCQVKPDTGNAREAVSVVAERKFNNSQAFCMHHNIECGNGAYSVEFRCVHYFEIRLNPRQLNEKDLWYY